ncbi:hypothetical protein VNO77_18030 [Canavalia gladiata]|uniref:Uncharacterized protein n=1 Tax=Canavalia gladiata TaxID=3824 RepID=A0AAN9LK33_CANGL
MLAEYHVCLGVEVVFFAGSVLSLVFLLQGINVVFEILVAYPLLHHQKLWGKRHGLYWLRSSLLEKQGTCKSLSFQKPLNPLHVLPFSNTGSSPLSLLSS